MELADVVNLLRQGHLDAAPMLVSLLAPSLYGYAAVVAPDLGDVDRELVCERAVELAAAKIDQYDQAIGPVTRWILPFVRHAAQDVRRRNGAHVAIDEQIDVAPRAVDPPSVAATTAETLLAMCTDAERLLLALRYTEHLTFAEIASALGEGVTEVAVRQRHARLLRDLRARATALLEETTR